MIITYRAVTKKVPGGLKVQSDARSFSILCDEPVDAGGTDAGMTPVEAVLCAFGSCQSIVAVAFAQAHGIDLKDYYVELEGDIDPDGFTGKNKNVRNGFSEIRFKMHFVTDDDPAKVEKYASFVESVCPVGDNLKNGVPLVRTEVVVHKS